MSQSSSSNQEVTIMVGKDDFQRLEGKVDDLRISIRVFEERQTHQGVRIGELESECRVLKSQLQEVNNKLESWINRGIGAWFIAGLVFAAVQVVVK